jgi:hypothetical protein
MTNASHTRPDDHGAGNQKRSVSGDVTVSGKIIIEASPEEKLSRDAAEKKRDSKDRKKKWLEIATLAVVTIYAGLTAWQAAESRRAAKAAEDSIAQNRDQFRRDQRPYIWATNTGLGTPQYFFPKPDEVAPGYTGPVGQIFWAYHFTNYGKSPAYNVITIARGMKLGKDSQFQASHNFSSPNTGTPLPPGKDDFADAVSDPGIDASRFKQLLAEDGAISIEVKIIYSDSYGGQYETGMCFQHLKTGAIQYCDHNNYIK